MDRRQDLRGELYRDRIGAVLDLFNRSRPPSGSVIVNVGTIDAQLARHAAEAGCSIVRLRMDQLVSADKAAAPAPAVILGLKILPWSRDARPALSAIARLMDPGTTLIIQFHNALRAGRLLDPRYNPVTRLGLSAAKRSADMLMGRPRAYHPSLPLVHTPGEVASLLTGEGLSIVGRRNVGYGPFTLLGKHLIPDDLACRIHRGLSDFSADSAPWLERFSSYVVLAARRSADGGQHG